MHNYNGQIVQGPESITLELLSTKLAIMTSIQNLWVVLSFWDCETESKSLFHCILINLNLVPLASGQPVLSAKY